MDINLAMGICSVLLSVVASIATSFLTLGKYKEKVDRLEKDSEKIDSKVDELIKNVAAMGANLSALEKTVDSLSDIAKSHSPISLTKKGEKLVEDSGFNRIFSNIKDDLVKDLENLKPYSQYDAQEKARMMLSSMINDNRFRQIEDWAYNNGQDFAQILRAGSIKLRDYYFEKHPEIVNPKEVY